MSSYTISPTLNKSRVFILQKSELEKRFDPLYYAMNLFGFLKTTNFDVKSIRDISKYTISGFGVGREEQDLTEKGFIQIRPTNLDEFGNLKFDKNVYLGDKYLETKKSNIIQKNDILFNNTNSQELVGKTAFFDLDDTYFHSNHITRIRVNEELIRPKFLYILLNIYQRRKIFYTLCTNWNNQSGVGIDLLNSIKIIIPNFEIQDKIIAVHQNSITQKQKNEAEAEKLLSSIDDYLLRELGIKLPKETYYFSNKDLKNIVCEPKDEYGYHIILKGNYKLDEQNKLVQQKQIFITNFSEVSGSRFDPYFHQEKFKQLDKNLLKGKFPISNLKKQAVLITSGATPLSKGDAYTEDKSLGVPFIRSGKIGNIDFDECIYIKPEIHNSMLKSSRLKKGDLLIAIVGATIGEVGIYDHDREGNINQAIALVRLNKGLLPVFAKDFFKSSIGSFILDRAKRPVARANINLDEIGILPIPVPPLSKQKEIAEHITGIRQQAQQLKDKTNELLKKASEEIEEILLN